MTYKGTLVKDLQSVVEACLESNSSRICVNCGRRYGDHWNVGHSYPDFSSAVPACLETRFVERRC